MNKVSILDCTLRDGGYVNKWDFGSAVTKKIISRLSEGNIEIVECGFLSQGKWSLDVAKFDSTVLPIEYQELFKDKVLYVGMIALGEKELHYTKIPPRSDNTLAGIRITFHREIEEVTKAIEFASDLMSKGYKVFMQPIGTMFYSDLELLTLISKMNDLNPYAFYIVDTLGSMNSEMLLRLFYLINHNLNKDIQIGFHGHNNLQLAFSNAKSIIDLHSDRDIIIDSSVFGMGRGAGNLCTELIADYLNSSYGHQYDCTKLFSIIDTCLLPIKQQFDWGYSAPYYLAAVKNCHPNYASYLLSKGTLLSVDIDKILTLVPKEESYLFDESLIQKLYLEYQRHQIEDKDTLKILSEYFKGKTVLLIAPGNSIMKEEECIHSLVDNPNVLTISINFCEKYKTDFLFFSNKKRFQYLKNTKIPIVATSNLDYVDRPCYVVNYSSLLNQTTSSYDNAGLMGIQLMIELGIEQIYLGGFDGFSDDNDHFDHRKCNYIKKGDSLQRNTDMEDMIKYYQTKVPISFITKTKYFAEERKCE